MSSDDITPQLTLEKRCVGSFPSKKKKKKLLNRVLVPFQLDRYNSSGQSDSHHFNFY